MLQQILPVIFHLLAVEGGNSVRPSDMVVTGSVFGNSTNKSEIDQYQFDGEYIFENSNSSIDFGIALTERRQPFKISQRAT